VRVGKQRAAGQLRHLHGDNGMHGTSRTRPGRIRISPLRRRTNEHNLRALSGIRVYTGPPEHVNPLDIEAATPNTSACRDNWTPERLTTPPELAPVATEKSPSPERALSDESHHAEDFCQVISRADATRTRRTTARQGACHFQRAAQGKGRETPLPATPNI